MMFNRVSLTARLASPAGALGIALTAAVVLAVVPARWTDPLRSTAADLLRPAESAATTLRQRARRAVAHAQSHFQSAQRMADVEDELRQVQAENRRLRAELFAAQNQPAAANDNDDAANRLLRIQSVPARVLGRLARAFLTRHHLLDIGAQAAIEPGDWVVDRPALIDRGTDADLAPGRLVLDGRCIWGKIARTSTTTSTVRTVTEPGYRDLVYLAAADATAPQRGERSQRPVEGVLEGTGEPLCRIRLVEATQPVSVGDLVYTAAGKGLLPAALLYGRIVRLERTPGAAHWDIWLQPAVGPDAPEHVAVLRTELSSLRVAKQGSQDTN